MNSRQVRTVVVDDESRIRRGIERLVQSCSDDFVVVGSFSSAIELLNYYHQKGLEVDLLITDIKMPGMDGLDLIKELRKFVTFEAVVISGFNDFKYLQTAIREGAVDYLVKPIIRDEFRQLLQRVKEKIKKKREEELRIEEIDSELNFVKQCQLLSELIRGLERDISELDWTRDFPQGNYFLFNISKDDVEVIPPESVENIITKFMKKNSQNTNCPFWLWKGDRSCYWVLIQTRGNEENLVSSLAKNLQFHIRSTTNHSNTITVSEMFQDLTLLPSIRDNLLSLLQFRLIYGGNQVYSFSSIESRGANQVKIKDSRGIELIINRILQSLERYQKDSEKLNLLLKQFLKEIGKLASPLDMERYIQLLTVQVVNQLLKYSSTKEEIPLIHEALYLTDNASNFIALRENLSNWMQKIFISLDKINKNNLANPVQISKQWILYNLGENITIEKIAREIPMNPTYFCEYFKSQTGETVLDYVTKTRIEKARELLISSDLKIYDIAEKVGYSDTKYFSKLFKKYFGEVPSKYKEKLRTVND